MKSEKFAAAAVSRVVWSAVANFSLFTFHFSLSLECCSDSEPGAGLGHVAVVDVAAVVEQVADLGIKSIAGLGPRQTGIHQGEGTVVAHLATERGVLAYTILPAQTYGEVELSPDVGRQSGYELVPQVLQRILRHDAWLQVLVLRDVGVGEVEGGSWSVEGGG